MKLLASLLFLGLLGCGAAHAPVAVPSEEAANEGREFALQVRGANGEGHLIWAPLSEEVWTALREGRAGDPEFAAVLAEIRVADERSIEGGLALSSSPAAFHFVLFQREGADVWNALFGHPAANQWVGWAEAGQDELDLVRGEDHPPGPEACSGERKVLMELPSPGVAGGIGNDTLRRVCVMLPPGYAEGDARFPVVFLLPGFGGSDTAYLHLAELDLPVVLVGIDGRTRFGATYFRDSAYAGQWEQFLVRVVQRVDTQYRTRDDARGLLGHSTGGYNAIAMAMRRTDLFHAAAASSPDALDLEHWLVRDGRVKPIWLNWARFDNALGRSGQMISYAAQFSDATNADQVAWPFDFQTGELNAEWRTWLEAQPLAWLQDEGRAASIGRQLSGKLFVSVGRQDAFDLFVPAERFHERLDALGIEHVWAPTDGNHFEGSAQRREAGLRFLAETLSR